MKRSDKLLLAFASVVVAAVLALLLALRAAATTTADRPMHREAITVDSMTYNGEPFTRVAASGGWTLRITRGDAYSVAVTRDDRTDTKVRVAAQGGTLALVSSSLSLASKGATATVTCPGLDALSTNGSVDATIQGFRGDSLSIATAGGSQIVARDCSVDRLELQVAGISDVNLKDVRARGARLDLGGAFDVVVTVDGGPLAGTAAGLGGLEVHGRVGANTLTASGLIDVTYHD
jgi:hypothetical protein